MCAGFAFLVVSLVVNAGPDQEEKSHSPISVDKWGFAYVETTWGLKLKSLSYNAKRSKYTFVMEFTKDLMPEELKAMKEAFFPTQSGIRYDVKPAKVRLCFFDKDNVLVETRTDFELRSLLTGVKGDACRMEIYGPSYAKDAVKAELRENKGPEGSGAVSEKAIRPGTGTLKGKVTLDGEMPDIAAMNKELLKLINEKASGTDKPHCLNEAPEDQKTQQDWRINKDNRGVADVFVFLKPPSGKFFAFDEKDAALKDAREAVEKQYEERYKEKQYALVLDQPHCAFVPHALILFPSYHDPQNKERPTGQKFIIKNSALIGHNVKYGDGGGRNPGANLTFAARSQKEISNLKPSRDPVSVSCAVHPWMSADIWVLDHPYYAITDKDGNYEIKNVPEGKVSIVAWHGKAKFLNPEGIKGTEITLGKDGGEKNFEIRAK